MKIEVDDEDEEGSFLEKLGSFVLSEKEVQRRNQDMITEEEWHTANGENYED